MQAAWAAEHEKAQTPPESGPLAEALNAEGQADLDAVRAAISGTKDVGPLDRKTTVPTDTKKDRRGERRAAYEPLMSEIGDPATVHTPLIEGGIGALTQYLIHQEDRAWQLASRPFVDSAIGKLVSRNPDALRGTERTIEKATLRLHPKYFDGSCLIEIGVSRLRFKSQELSRGLGKLLLMERMLGRSMNKFLALCVDLRDPSDNPRLQGDIVTAKSLGITLEFFSPEEDIRLADAMADFIEKNSLQARDMRSQVRRVVSRVRTILDACDQTPGTYDDSFETQAASAIQDLAQVREALRQSNLDDAEKRQLDARVETYFMRLSIEQERAGLHTQIAKDSRAKARSTKP
jgi:hypothetical protein